MYIDPLNQCKLWLLYLYITCVCLHLQAYNQCLCNQHNLSISHVSPKALGSLATRISGFILYKLYNAKIHHKWQCQILQIHCSILRFL